MASTRRRQVKGYVVNTFSSKTPQELKEQFNELKEKNLAKDQELAWFKRELAKEKNRREDFKTSKKEIEELSEITKQSASVLRGLIYERYELEQQIKHRLPKPLRKCKSRSHFVQTDHEVTSREQGSQASPLTQEKAVMTEKPRKPVIEDDCSLLVGFFARW